MEQNWLSMLQMVQFECAKHLKARIVMQGLSSAAKTVLASFIYLSLDGTIVFMLQILNPNLLIERDISLH